MLKNMMLNSKNIFLESLLTSIGDGVIATDLSGNITIFNTVAEEITGWSVSDTKNKRLCELFTFIDDTTNKIMESTINNVIKLGTKISIKESSVLITKKKEHKYISGNVCPIKDELGIVLGILIIFKDITITRNVELNLKEDKNNFMRVFNSAPIGFIVVDENEIITNINNCALDLLNINKEKSIGKRFGDAFFCKESFRIKQGCGSGIECKICDIKKAISLALKSGVSTTNIEFSRIFIINKNKREFWFKASITQMTDGDNKMAVIVLVDITDTKNKETEISKSRDYYLGMFENFPAVVWKTDIEGKNEYVNKNCYNFTGKYKEDCLAFEWLTYIHPEDKDKCYELYNKSFENKQPYDMEYRALNSSGEYRWIQSINRPVKNSDGKFDGYIGIGLDITDRKIAEEGLNRYKILSEKVRDIIHFIDTEGNIIDVNQSGLNSYGYTYEEFLKLNIIDLRAEGVITSELLRSFDKEGAFYETVHRRKDGSKFPVEISCQGAEIGGKRVLISIIRDITERKSGENNLKAAKEAAETANRVKSEFLANMSHEIRTPINGIVGMVDLTLLTELNNEHKENLMIVKSCANSLLKIINDILDFSKMEAGKLKIENINFDIKYLVEEIIKSHSPSAIIKGIELNYEFSSNIHQYVVGDPNRVKQILNNIISNAIKFTESGEVWIKVKEIKSNDNKVEIQFVVEDSGIGIPEEKMCELFQSFSQLDGSITRKFGGTGLGLVISKQLSELMGGRLRVESKKGIGSKFYFTLNFNIGTMIETKSIQSSKLMKLDRRYNLLLAEDNNVNQMIITRILRNRGYYIDTVSNGLEAVEMCGKKSYDAILMDIQMPVMDGIEATKRIKENNKNTPIIAITAYALKGDRERFLAQGIDEYVSKPVKIDELLSTINKCLSPDKENLSNIDIHFDEMGEIVLQPKKIQDFDKSKIYSILDEVSNLIMNLKDAITRSDIGYVEILAHKMKNLSNEIGIDELKVISFKIELAARRGDYIKIVEKVEEIEYTFEVLKKTKL